MPWLIKDKPTLEEKLFFVHVPRCGGTSLMHHFDVPHKVMEGRSCWGRFGMRTFFHRYKLLESANFPIWTFGNLMAIVLFILSMICTATQYNRRFNLWILGLVLLLCSLIFFVSLSFVFTAPTIGRFLLVRRAYLLLVDKVLCKFMESIDWCTGTNRTGYMMHLTAPKLLAYGYVTPEEMERCCSMAIVRNPYSRMISVYSYNKFGGCESFSHFVKSWYRHGYQYYRESGEMDEWYTACHVIPQFEFTHFEGKQLVQSIVKQEELKLLKTKEDTPKAIAQDSSVANLPEPVKDALLGMPHTNSRKTAKKWYEYFDQETLDLTYEMYQHDFEVFGYSPILTQRPDLQPPALYRKQQAVDLESSPPPVPLTSHRTSISVSSVSVSSNSTYRHKSLEGMLRDSKRNMSDERRSMRHDMLRRSSLGSNSLASGRFRSSTVGSQNEILRDLADVIAEVEIEDTEHGNQNNVDTNADGIQPSQPPIKETDETAATPPVTAASSDDSDKK